MGKEIAFRADAAFAKPEVYEALEERGVKYAIRIPANDILQRDIEELLAPWEGPPRNAGRVQGVLVPGSRLDSKGGGESRHHSGELFPRVGFIVTNLTLPNRAVVRFYNKRGTRTVDQGRQAGGEDDAAQLPQVPI